MEFINKFIDWIKDVAQPLTDLYEKDSDAFFIGAIAVIAILLVVVCILARRSGSSEGKPKRKIKYDEIDWSIDGDAYEETEPVSKAASGSSPHIGAHDTADYRRSMGAEEPAAGRDDPLPEERRHPAHEKRFVENVPEDFGVPDWMSKHTISLDAVNDPFSKEWIDEELHR